MTTKFQLTNLSNDTYATAGRHSDLDGVATGLADFFEVERPVARRTVHGTVNRQQSLIDTDAH